MNSYNLTKRGGGICVYVRSSISFVEMKEDHFKVNGPDLELITIRLTIENIRPIFIIGLYRPPAGLIQPFNNHLTLLFDKLALNRKFDVIFGGDFNIDYRKCSPNRKVLKDLEISRN